MRKFAAIYLRTAEDPDFQRLHFREQHMYWTLLRQRKLNRAGLLDLNIYRWAQSADGMSEEHVAESLAVLAERRYVVIDEHTRELLVRTYVRNDEAYKMPKVMAAVVSAAHEIESPRLRHALLLELDRIPLDELSDEPTATGGPSVRSRVLGYITQLRKILGSGSPDGPNGLDIPADTPTVGQLKAIAGVSDTPGDTRSQPSGVRARARGVPSPAPTPEPVPLPHSALFEVADPTPATATGRRRKPAKEQDPAIAERNKLAVELAQAWWDSQTPKPAGRFVAYQQIAARLLEAGHEPDAIAEAFKRCGISLTIASAQFQLQRMAEHAGRVVVPFQRPGHQPYMEDDTRTYGSLASAFDTAGA